MKKVLFWHRRDLRIDDNHGLAVATGLDKHVQPIFIFDEDILSHLAPDDRRVSFIYDQIKVLKATYQAHGSDLRVVKGRPLAVFKALLKTEDYSAIYSNKDYEPYGKLRDHAIADWAKSNDIEFKQYKDHVIFEQSDFGLDRKPYRVFTPFSKVWKRKLNEIICHKVDVSHLVKGVNFGCSDLTELGFKYNPINAIPPKWDREILEHYAEQRDEPSASATSYLGAYLRFGTVSIRRVVKAAKKHSEAFLNALIWREFFIIILDQYPDSVTSEFKPKYRQLVWEKDEEKFKKWCLGQTGFPLIDAGMRELNATGFMHNRVRMVVASFLVKDLRIDWRWGEAYFAQHLLDYELASNIGNWQWAAGTGTDAAPYFRVFNPKRQQERFDPDFKYINKWVPEYGSENYPAPMVDHQLERTKTLAFYKSYLSA